jgi:hypothetical protein
MARVYTPKEIRSGRYPREGSFEVAKAQLTGRIMNDPHFTGCAAVFYGSSATGELDMRSDVDTTVVVPRKLRFDDEALGKHIAKTVREATGVTIDVGVVPSPLASEHLLQANRDSPLSLGTQRYFAEYYPQAAFGDITVLGEQADISVKHVSDRALSYLAFRGRLDQPTLDYDQLERAFGLPNSVGRYATKITNATLGDDARHASRLSGNAWVSANISPDSALGQIAQMDATYTDILLETIDGKVSVENYKNYLAEVGVTVAQLVAPALQEAKLALLCAPPP